MNITKIYCDRCGEEIEMNDGDNPRQYGIMERDTIPHRYLDLCPRCYYKFVRWLTDEKEIFSVKEKDLI
jgi:hypothetical protein